VVSLPLKGTTRKNGPKKKEGSVLIEIGCLFDVCWYGNLCWFVFAEFLVQKHFVC
jgi:hypothetical protein